MYLHRHTVRIHDQELQIESGPQSLVMDRERVEGPFRQVPSGVAGQEGARLDRYSLYHKHCACASLWYTTPSIR